MSSSGRPLLAARNLGDDPSKSEDLPNQSTNQNAHLGGKPKRTLIESACAACRKRKSRCDGQRPACTRCQNLRTECVYEAEEGESRWSALKRRSHNLEAERDDLKEILSLLQYKPEPEAMEIFHRIRSSGYDELLMMARHARESGSSTRLQSAPAAVGEQRLPPIRTIMDVSGSAQMPIAHGSIQRPSRRSMQSDGSTESYSSTHSAYDHTISQPPSA